MGRIGGFERMDRPRMAVAVGRIGPSWPVDVDCRLRRREVLLERG